MGNALWYPLFRGTDNDGNPLNGGKLHTYDAGTSTPRAAYADEDALTPLSNPVVLDSRGEKAIWLSGTYKLILKDSSDVTIWTLDDIVGATVTSVIWSVAANEAALGTGTVDGECKISAANGNKYWWDDGNSKWSPDSGNRYATGSLPASGTYAIETGCLAFDTTTKTAKYYDGSSWLSITQKYGKLKVPASFMIPCTTNGCAALENSEKGTNDLDRDYLAFGGGATEERCQFSLTTEDLEGWDFGTIKAKLLWSSDTGSTTGDTVEWGVKAGAFSDGDPLDAALGTAQVISDTLLADNGGDGQLSGATPAITVGGTPAAEDEVLFEIYRNTDGTDDMAEDAWLMAVIIEFTKDQTVSLWS